MDMAPKKTPKFFPRSVVFLFSSIFVCALSNVHKTIRLEYRLKSSSCKAFGVFLDFLCNCLCNVYVKFRRNNWLVPYPIG